MKKTIAILLIALLTLAAASAETLSLTTGLPTDKAYKPIVCQFDNEPGARPQCGMASADVAYETEVYNGGYTRYTCVFNDTIPEKVEAVRSARMLHLDIYQDWGGIFACFGFQDAEGSNAKAYAAQVVSRLFNGHVGDKGFYRDKKRKAPNNVVFKMGEIYDSVDDSFEEKSPFTFSSTPTVQGDKVSSFKISYRADYTPSYEWDAASGVYKRFYNGKPQNDGITGEQLSYSNVIVQHVNYSWYGGASNRPMAEFTGTNRCDYFIGGNHFTGYWTRGSVSENTVYYDDNGNVVQFAPGKTFVQIVKEQVNVEYDVDVDAVAAQAASEATVEDIDSQEAQIDVSEATAGSIVEETVIPVENVQVSEVAVDELLDSAVETETLSRGSEGEEVRKLQAKLIELQLLSGQPDGKYGKYTEDAVKQLQASFGMEQTGVADSAFLAKLYE